MRNKWASPSWRCHRLLGFPRSFFTIFYPVQMKIHQLVQKQRTFKSKQPSDDKYAKENVDCHLSWFSLPCCSVIWYWPPWQTRRGTINWASVVINRGGQNTRRKMSKIIMQSLWWIIGNNYYWSFFCILY